MHALLTVVFAACLQSEGAGLSRAEPPQPADSRLAEPASPDPTPPPPARTLEAMLAVADSYEPARRLGVRSNAIQQSQLIAPVVLIAESDAGFLDALSSWQGRARVPVLYDDGSPEARETIGRFIHAFEPRRVLRINSDGKKRISGDALRDRLAELHTAVLAVNADGVIPEPRSPGLVVYDPRDPAWPAAIALAVARRQPLATMRFTPAVSRPIEPTEADRLAADLNTALASTGLSWRRLGDDIDAITLVGTLGIKVRDETHTFIATSDRLGRLPDGTRFAWTSHIFGDRVSATAAAMASLFLPPSSAWIFDGYTPDRIRDRYDGTGAGEVFAQAGLPNEVHDHPRNTGAHWRHNASRSIDAALILINSHGQAASFHAANDRLAPGDVPLLDRPAAIHMVHSFSATRADRADTVAGRWLANGAFAYLGSVHEPTIAAFIPTPNVAARLASGFPWANAGRAEGEQPWKIAAIGDPLWTLGSPGQRLDDSAISAAEGVTPADAGLDEQPSAERIRILVMLDRREAVATEVRLLLDSGAGDAPAAVAEALALLAKTDDHELALRAATLVARGRPTDRITLDAIWAIARAATTRSARDAGTALMQTAIREDQRVDDAIEIAERLAAAGHIEAAAGLLRSESQRSEREPERRRLGSMLRRLTGAP